MSFDLLAHMKRQMAWSKATFGPAARQEGIFDHMRKEMLEISLSNRPSKEWVDLVILSLDGLWRAMAHEGVNWRDIPAEVVTLLDDKQATNEQRYWPNWRDMPENKAIEHVRSHDHGRRDRSPAVDIPPYDDPDEIPL